ncbi:MAG: hypothetical protein Kow0069_22090 [Promethearchaeota archaeon]
MNEFVALVLAAGRGRRMDLVTRKGPPVPKPLAEVAGLSSPLVVDTVKKLARVENVKRVVVVLGYQADMVRGGVESALNAHKSGVPEEKDWDWTWTVANDWTKGPLFSFLAGAASLRLQGQRDLLVVPGDTAFQFEPLREFARSCAETLGACHVAVVRVPSVSGEPRRAVREVPTEWWSCHPPGVTCEVGGGGVVRDFHPSGQRHRSLFCAPMLHASREFVGWVVKNSKKWLGTTTECRVLDALAHWTRRGGKTLVVEVPPGCWWDFDRQEDWALWSEVVAANPGFLRKFVPKF